MQILLFAFIKLLIKLLIATAMNTVNVFTFAQADLTKTNYFQEGYEALLSMKGKSHLKIVSCAIL